jgi:phosphoribosylformimino-5-aminoimidazole carboxamide ribotide isomerase
MTSIPSTSRDPSPMQTDLISRLVKSVRLKVQCGGGVRSADDVRRLLDAGANRVVVGTKAIEDWRWFENLMSDPAFAHRVVLALDAREGQVATRGWTETTGRLAVDVARQVASHPLGAILYTDVARDGMLQGPNIEQTRKLAEAGPVPVIASGGVGHIDHITALLGKGIWGVIVGRSLYEGKVDLKEALTVAAGH